MDLELVMKGSDYTKKRRNWGLVLGVLGFTGYGVYRVYHLPSAVQKRKKLMKLFGALISIAEAALYSAEAIGVVSKDLKTFLQSDSDRIPNGLRQVSKITQSEEFSESVIGITRALSVGIMRGYRLKSRNGDETSVDSSFPDRVLDKLFSTSGSGFASVVVGSFAKNLAMAFYSGAQISGSFNMNNSKNLSHSSSDFPSVPDWANVVCAGEKCRELVGDCIKLFVSTAVSVYLDKTMHINPYDDIFSGLTNPKHETKMKDMLKSVSNGAVETLIITSNKVLNSNSDHSFLTIDDFEGQTTFNEEFLGQEPPSTQQKVRKSFDENEDSWWVNEMNSVLPVPINMKFVLDVTGKVTFETVRSFLEILLDKLCDGMRSSLNVVYDAIVETGLGILRYVTGKSSSFVTICISLCLHILGGAWVLVSF